MRDSSPPRRPAFAVDLDVWGDAPALLTAAAEISYRTLAELADAFADRLGSDVKLLAIEGANALHSIVAYLGALRAGIPVVLHGGGPNAAHILAACPPDATYALDGETWSLEIAPRAWDQPPHPDLAVLLSTSGSTGSAKLVRLSAGNLHANARSIGSYLELGPAERAITSLPPSYSYGLSVLNSHLSVGASIVLSDETVASPAFRDLVARNDVTSIAGVPYSYELMLRSGLLARLPSSVRTLTQAGGRMAPDLVAEVAEHAGRAGARLFVMYGQTEATARIAFLAPDRLADHLGAIGVPIPGGDLWVEDGDGRRLPPGVEGELIYRGPNVMMGYATSRADLAAAPGPDVLRTGDLAVENDEGIFRITGRTSRFVKPFGLRISLDELELRCREAGVDAFAAGDDALIVVASRPDAAGVVKATLQAFDLPADLVEVLALDTIPRLQGGKPDYQGLLHRGREARAQSSGGDQGIAEVEALFTRLAGERALTDDVTFESLGGDSLSYVQCSVAIESALGNVPEAWEQLSLGSLRKQAKNGQRNSSIWRWATVESDIVVRGLAILQVLFQHALNGVPGGADVLMVLAGFSWSRFQRSRLESGESRDAFLNFATRYLSIYVAILFAVFAINKHILRSHLFFYSTFIGDWGGILNTYWFMESLAWCIAVLCGLYLIPQVRRFSRSSPLGGAIAFVALALVVRVAGETLLDADAHAHRSPDLMLLYFAAGWALALAGRALKAALFAILICASAIAWGWRDTHIAALLIAAALMIGFPRFKLPLPLARSMTLVAAASFYIYLANPIPMYLTDQVLHAQFGRYWTLQIVLSMGLGLALYWGARRLPGSTLKAVSSLSWLRRGRASAQ
jgi:acyl-CoA synthetase (AMP-forming)/AMP-acid ligase II